MGLAAGVLGRDMGGLGTVWAARPEAGEARDCPGRSRDAALSWRRVGGPRPQGPLPPRAPGPRGDLEGLRAWPRPEGGETGIQTSSSRSDLRVPFFLCFSSEERVEKENNCISALVT